jgi:hypothetical protein
MAELGLNVDGRAAIAPASIAALGARWCRAVAYPDEDISNWIRECHQHGVRVLLVLAGESIGHSPSGWAGRIAYFRGLYGSFADAIQVATESDHVSDSSWTMEPAELSQLLRVARFQLGPDAYIVGSGMASGNPDWARRVDWGPCSAVACHPYTKEPGSAELNWLLDGYMAAGKPLWVTEYHARSLGMAAALRDDPRVEVALAFCYTSRMVDGFGLIEDPAALADFKTAAASGGTSVPDSFIVGDGMRALMARRGDVPAADEIYFKGPAGTDEWSECMAASGRLYRYVFSLNKTFSYPPEAA